MKNTSTTTLPDIDQSTETGSQLDTPFNVVVWNDPINLMNFVTHVFMKVLGMNTQTAEKHMKEVHEKGKSVVYSGSFEKAEFYVSQLVSYKLTATLEKPEQ